MGKMQRAMDGGMGKRDRGVSDSGNETTFPGGRHMSDLISRQQPVARDTNMLLGERRTDGTD